MGIHSHCLADHGDDEETLPDEENVEHYPIAGKAWW